MVSNLFISSPFIKCPKCGNKTFGVLSIEDNQYTRKCKKCLYPQQEEPDVICALPELHKRIIYIDQNAMSDMMKSLNPETESYKQGRIDVFWRNLFLKLDRLCKLQLVVCPASATHTKESAISQFYQALKQVYELLSCGVRFKDFATIKSFQLHEHAKNWISGNLENGINLDVDSFDLIVEVISTSGIDPGNAFYNLSLNPTVDTINIIGILQSPLADRYLRIYYYIGSSPLPGPHTQWKRLIDAGEEGVQVTFGSNTAVLGLMTDRSDEGYRIYYGDIVLPAGDGIDTLLFLSEDIRGNQYTPEYPISVKSIGVEGGYIASVNNSFRVDIPENAFEKSYHVTACNTGRSYYVGPNMNLNVNAILTIDVSDRESDKLSIYRKDGNNWIEIPCIRKGDKVEAEIKTLGEFKVMEGNLVTNIPLTLELTTNTLTPFDIRYAIPEKGKVRIDIYNALGQRIKTLVNSVVNPGFYTARWDARADNGVMVGNGIYFYRLSATGENITKKIVLVR